MADEKADRFSLEAVTNHEEWDRFVDKSWNGTFFSNSKFLKATGRKFVLFYVRKGTEIKAGVSLLLSASETKTELDDFVIYNGVIFSALDRREKPYSMLSTRFLLIEFIVQELAKKYSSIQMSLTPEITDIRPFLWHNYHSDNPLEKFRPDIRYTSYVNLTEFDPENDEQSSLYLEMGVSRRQEIRYARRDGMFVEESNDIESFARLYPLPFERQGRLTDEIRRRTNWIVSTWNELRDSQSLKLFLVKDKEGSPISGALFSLDSKRAYYFLGANDPSKQTRHSGTIVLWEAFRHLRRMGVTEIDMEGVNSPTRGWFKLSFGGTLETYYQLYLGE